MNSIPKPEFSCLENIQSEPSSASSIHVRLLIQSLALRVVGKPPKSDREIVTVTVSFSPSLIRRMDAVYGKTYTTTIYKQAFQQSKRLAAHLFSLFSGQQTKLFRTSFDRCKAVYGVSSPVLDALAGFPTGDQQLRWASAPSSGAWAPGSSSRPREAVPERERPRA